MALIAPLILFASTKNVTRMKDGLIMVFAASAATKLGMGTLEMCAAMRVCQLKVPVKVPVIMPQICPVFGQAIYLVAPFVMT